MWRRERERDLKKLEWNGKERKLGLQWRKTQKRERERSKGKAKLREVMNKKRDLHL